MVCSRGAFSLVPVGDVKYALAVEAEVGCLRKPFADIGLAPYRHDQTLTMPSASFTVRGGGLRR